MHRLLFHTDFSFKFFQDTCSWGWAMERKNFISGKINFYSQTPGRLSGLPSPSYNEYRDLFPNDKTPGK